jgi:sarcosine oxidase, subunit gamma
VAATAAASSGTELCTGTADIVELAAARAQEAALRALAAARGYSLPAFGCAASHDGRLALCVRPNRWLLLQPRPLGREDAEAGPASNSAGDWQAACDGIGSAVDLSSGLTLLLLRGPHAVELLDRHCRLDLRREHFAVGRAAASLIAQVPIIMVTRARGLLLATPSSTSRHFREWLVAAGRPFGLGAPRSVATEELLGD